MLAPAVPWMHLQLLPHALDSKLSTSWSMQVATEKRQCWMPDEPCLWFTWVYMLPPLLLLVASDCWSDNDQRSCAAAVTVSARKVFCCLGVWLPQEKMRSASYPASLTSSSRGCLHCHHTNLWNALGDILVNCKNVGTCSTMDASAASSSCFGQQVVYFLVNASCNREASVLDARWTLLVVYLGVYAAPIDFCWSLAIVGATTTKGHAQPQSQYLPGKSFTALVCGCRKKKCAVLLTQRAWLLVHVGAYTATIPTCEMLLETFWSTAKMLAPAVPWMHLQLLPHALDSKLSTSWSMQVATEKRQCWMPDEPCSWFTWVYMLPPLLLLVASDCWSDNDQRSCAAAVTVSARKVFYCLGVWLPQENNAQCFLPSELDF